MASSFVLVFVVLIAGGLLVTQAVDRARRQRALAKELTRLSLAMAALEESEAALSERPEAETLFVASESISWVSLVEDSPADALMWAKELYSSGHGSEELGDGLVAAPRNLDVPEYELPSDRGSVDIDPFKRYSTVHAFGRSPKRLRSSYVTVHR